MDESGKGKRIFYIPVEEKDKQPDLHFQTTYKELPTQSTYLYGKHYEQLLVPSEKTSLLTSRTGRRAANSGSSAPTSYQNPSEPSVLVVTSHDEVDAVLRSHTPVQYESGGTIIPRDSQIGSEVATRSYLSRFWILGIFSILAWYQCLQWNTWGPISESVNMAFPGWGSETVAMMANWGTISFVLFVTPMCWLMNAKGLRAGVLTCTALIAIGNIMRIVPFATTNTTFFTIMCHVCAICVGIPGTLVMAAPPTLAADWFPPKERTTATAFAQVMNQLGNAGGYLEPLLVRSPADKATADEIRSDIKHLLYAYTGASVALFLATLVYFPSKPPSPPSITSSVERIDFTSSVKRVLSTRDVLLVTISYGVFLGAPSAWVSVLNYSLVGMGMHQDDAMWVGLFGTVLASAAALLAGRMTDMVYGYVRLSLIVLMILDLGCFYWFFLLNWGTIPISTWQVYVSVIGGLTFNFATAPLFFELAVECAYPCPEGVVGGFMTGINNLVGLTFLFLFFIPDIGFSWVTYTLIALSALSIIPLLFVREEYSRSNIDRGTDFSSPYETI